MTAKKVNWKSILTKLQGKDAFEKTCIFGKLILHELGATNPEKARSGQEIYEKLCAHVKKAKATLENLSRNTFFQYLCKAAASSGNNIFCEGRKQGYYVRTEEAIIDDESETASSNKPAGEEALLYPVAERWLRAHEFNAKVIATKKKNGLWGNPDVMGVKVREVCGRQDVEIVTIECKNSLYKWKSQIFEAVAHKRFADRVYFAFVLPIDEVKKKYEELVEYAEYYGVGLLVLELEPSVFKRYNDKGDGKIAKYLEYLEFREIYHAPQNHCLFQARKEFLEGLEVTTADKLSCFGESKTTLEGVPDRGLAKQPRDEKKKQQNGAGGAKGGKGRGKGVSR